MDETLLPFLFPLVTCSWAIAPASSLASLPLASPPPHSCHGVSLTRQLVKTLLGPLRPSGPSRAPASLAR